MPKQQVRRYERLYRGEPDPLRATLPPPDYVPLWRRAWKNRRLIGLIVLGIAIGLPPAYVAARPAVVRGGFGGHSGPTFREGAVAYQETGIENRMPFDVQVTRIETFESIEWMSPPGFAVRIGSAYEGVNPDTLPAFRPFTLKSHQVVAVYLMARQRCPDRVRAHSEGSYGTSALSSFRVHYRAFGVPFRTDLEMSGLREGFIEPTSKDCPSSKPLT